VPERLVGTAVVNAEVAVNVAMDFNHDAAASE